MSESKIITVTLNPTLDTLIPLRYLALGYQNHVEGTTTTVPSGEGINISRALQPLGIPTQAVVLVGQNTAGNTYLTLAAKESFPTLCIEVEGATNSNLILLDKGNSTETSLSELGELLYDEKTVQQLERTVRELLNEGDRLVLAGNVPNAYPTTAVLRLIQIAKEAKAQTVVALSQKEFLTDALQTKPDLVALSRYQAEAHFNRPIRAQEDVNYFASELLGAGAQNILLEMTGRDQAYLLTSGQEEFLLTLPEADKGTSGGVWEALLAGYLAGRLQQQPIAQAFELGAAAATFTASQVGQEFGDSNQIEPLLDGVAVEKIS